MKNFLKLILLVVSLFSFNKNAFSCDALNISIGEEVSQASEVIDVIEEYVKEDYEEYATVEYQDNTIYYCPDIGLDNTILKVFINESKIAGIRLETWDPNLEKNNIYKYANNIYGGLDNEVIKDDWIGYKDISIGSNKLFYAKMKYNNGIVDGIIESFDITTEELMDYTVSENMMEVGE